MTWTQNLENFPNACGLSGISDRGSGPYLQTDLFYRTWDEMDERVYRLYISNAYLKSVINEKDSPSVMVDRDEYDKLLKEHHDSTKNVEELAQKALDKMLADPDLGLYVTTTEENAERDEELERLRSEVADLTAQIEKVKELAAREKAVNGAVAAAKPKRRGRPPGSRNKKKAAA